MQSIAVLGTDAVAVCAAKVVGLPHPSSSLDSLSADATIVIVSAEAHFDRLVPTIRDIARRGVHVVAACEEMAWPWYRHPHLSDVLNNETVRWKAAVVGVGGMIVETLPLISANTISQLRSVRVHTRGNREHLRPAAAQRLGLGMHASKWKTLRKTETVGLIGVAECVTLLAQGLGRHPMHSDVSVQLTPVTGDDGHVSELRSVGRFAAADLSIECAFESTLDPSEAGKQTVVLVGEKTVELVIDHAAGLEALAHRLVYAARHVASLTPGLHTTLDLPLSTNASDRT